MAKDPLKDVMLNFTNALPMEELHIWLLMKSIVEPDMAPWKQLIKVADRSAADRSGIMAPR